MKKKDIVRKKKHSRNNIPDIDIEVKALKSGTESANIITLDPAFSAAEEEGGKKRAAANRVGWVIFNLLTLGMPAIFRDINKRTKFKIAGKMTLVYSLMLTVIYAILSTILISLVHDFSIRNERAFFKAEFAGINILSVTDGEDRGYYYLIYEGETLIASNIDDQDNINEYYNMLAVKDKTGQYSVKNGYFYETKEETVSGTKYTVVVAKDFKSQRDFTINLVITSALLYPVFLLVFIVLGLFTGRGILKPIDKINAALRAMNAKTLSARIETPDAKDELRELTEAINTMLKTLEDSFLQQTAFVSNASHELRTPIAVIQGYSNLLSRWGKEKAEIVNEAIPAIKKEAENMKTLIEKLLFLTKLGNRYELNYSRYVLDETIEEIVNETRMIDKKHHIVLRKGRSTEIEADRELIKLTLRIFMDNAIKYTPAGKSIEIGCSIIDGNVNVLVKDYGTGIDEADLPHIFERFYRCDKARGRAEGSTGLGLSIAKQIVDLHNGDILVSSKKGIGTQFLIELPQKFGGHLIED